MRIGATILSLMMIIGLSLAAQTAAVNAPANAGAISSLLRPSEQILSPKTSPQMDPPGDTLHVDLEAFNNAVGLTAGGTFYTAARLTAPRACTVVTVIFYKWDASSDNYLFVWGAGTSTQPGAVIESIPYTGSTTMAWQSIDLTTPVVLANGEDIWVGPRIQHAAGTYALGVDDGPYVATRGDWINYQGTWEELGPLGLSMNWHIRAILGAGGAPLTNDVGATSVLAPGLLIPPGSYAPKALIRNFGSAAQSGFDVECWIDSLGNNVYDNTITYAGTLAPGAVDTVEFTPWSSGPSGNTYSLRVFTSLAGDENPANDTARRTIAVQSAIWETIPKPTSPDRIVHATVYHPVTDKIYMIGGNPAGQTGTYMTTCQEFNPVSGTWTTKAPMTTARGWLPGSYCNGNIYLIGGHNNSSAAIATNECFDPVANSWTAKAARPRIGLAAAEVTWNDSLIYVLGGNNGSAGFNNVDIYDPANDAWTVGTALPAVAFMGSAAIIGDTIFMVQAYNGSSCWSNLYKGVIDPTNPQTITWTPGPAPTEPIFNGATVAMNGDIYWLGGFISAATVTNHIWKYSTATGAITAVTPNYPATLARLNFMVARPSTQELYVFAGDASGDWSAPNQQYWHISFGGSDIEEQRIALGGSIDNVSPTLARNSVRINFTVARQGNVNLNVYDATGKMVRTLVNGTVQAGSRSVTWNRTDNNGRQVANGSYFYRLTVNGKTVSSKSIIVN